MASQTIIRRILLPVTIDAKAHRVLHGSRRDGHLTHISMASRTLDFFSNVWRVIEPNMRFIRPAPNTLPWDILPLVVIRLDLLYFCVIREVCLMAAPAK